MNTKNLIFLVVAGAILWLCFAKKKKPVSIESQLPSDTKGTDFIHPMTPNMGGSVDGVSPVTLN